MRDISIDVSQVMTSVLTCGDSRDSRIIIAGGTTEHIDQYGRVQDQNGSHSITNPHTPSNH